ncbi:MAG: hypothetical protein H6672_01045 [Anaerolineaceae bacterium]|nr:hypothetical protein [Anaerolineaceae bacterium]
MQEKSFGFYDLVETFPKPGCAVCNLLEADAYRQLDNILYERVTDPPTQTAFRVGRGLCSEHGNLLVTFSHALGIAILYEAVLDATLKALDQAEKEGSSSGGWGRLWNNTSSNDALIAALEPGEPCIICAAQDEHEARYIRILTEHINDNRLESAYRASDGLCRQHFQMTLRDARNAAHARLLLNIQRDIWVRLRGELREFARKYDFKHVNEKMGAEGDSWRRAVQHYSGSRSVFGPRRSRK